MDLVRKTVAKTGDGMEFVLSDATVDRYGDIIEPSGWDLKWFKKNPIALFGHSSAFPIGTWSNVRVEGGKLLAKLHLAQRGTSQRIDELISLVEQGVLRAVSVGFKPIKREPLDKEKPYDGSRFLQQELMECSLVSVPANPAALAVAKSLNLSNDTMSLAFGEHADFGRRDMTSGRHAAKPPSPKAKAMTTATLSQRIEAAQNDLNEAKDALSAHVTDDAADAGDTEALATEVEQCERRLASLKRAETALATRTTKTEADPAAAAVRKPLGIKMREPKAGDLVIRAAVCSVMAKVTKRDPITVLEERYGDHEATNVFVRAAVDPAKTSVQGWASELIETETAAFLETLRDISFFPRLAQLGTNLQFGPGRGAIKIPSRAATPSISGSFVAEGAPIPVRRFGLTSKLLSPHKMGVISYFTNEMAKYSNPQIEGLLRQEIRGDTADTIDTLLIDTTAGSTTRPAGLLYNLAALTASTASGWEAILEDIETLAAPFDTAKAGRSLVLLMNRREARKLRMVPGPDGKLGWAGEILSEAGITPIASVNVPAGRLIMIDAADFSAAAGDQPDFDVSEEAVFHAEDTAPAQISAAGSPNTVAAPVISMFQTASIALRMLLDVTWAMRREGMVQWIDGADWSYVQT